MCYNMVSKGKEIKMRKILSTLLLATISYSSIWHVYDVAKDAYYYTHDRSHYHYNNYNSYKKNKKEPTNYNYHPPKNNTILKKKIFNHLHCSKIISNQVISSCYSYRLKSTIAVAYVVDGSVVNLNNITKRPKWTIDKRIPKQYRGNSRDYSYSGYDRGHMAPDADFDAYENILKQVYDININVVPQSPMVNRKTWLKAEKYERYMAVKLDYVDIIDIPIFNKNPKRIGIDKIAVPKGFYKIIYNNKYHFEKCFYYKNNLHVDWRSDRLSSHLINCHLFNSKYT